VAGWDVGILGDLDGDIIPMKVGGKRRLEIPSQLAYGSSEVGPIPANQDLSFDLEVIYAEKKNDLSIEKRAGGYALALVVPLVLLLIVYGVILSN
jgi:FKBP-type peptidyl-prolyl cis-trans isomerase